MWYLPEGEAALFEEEEEGIQRVTNTTSSNHSNAKRAKMEDDDRSKISEFLKAHNCYELMPPSSKIVALDIGLAVKSAFHALGENNLKSAPIWDSTLQDYAGMITVSDFIEILLYFHKQAPKVDILKELEKQQIKTWREIISKQRPPIDKLIASRPEESLYEASKILLDFRIHRLPIVARSESSNTILHIATHYGILSFLMQMLKEKPATFSQSIESLGIGTYQNLITVTKDTPLHLVLSLLLERKISALPIVDEKGRAIDIYTKSNVTSLVKQVSHDFLDKPVGNVLENKHTGRKEMFTFNKSETLEEVLNRLIKTRVYRLICVDPSNDQFSGILSLRDILQYFLQH